MAFTDAIITPTITSADLIAAVQDGLTAQGYTTIKAGFIDSSISSRSTFSGGAVASVTDKAGFAPTLIEIESSAVLAKQTAVLAIPTAPLLAANYIAPDNAGITAAFTAAQTAATQATAARQHLGNKAVVSNNGLWVDVYNDTGTAILYSFDVDASKNIRTPVTPR
jgi:hypothetical protein